MGFVVSLSQDSARIHVPDGLAIEAALRRTTHLGVGAHPDDLEVMTWHGIASCYASPTSSFTGVVVADGASSPRSGRYASFDDAAMIATRRDEQLQAATQGRYGALAYLGHTSAEVRRAQARALAQDLDRLLAAMRPEVVYTHNLFDAHETHVAVAVHLVAALRRLPLGARPKVLYGCEVWRGLDWLDPEDKVVFDVSAQAELNTALVALHASQIAGGKRYDLATLARKRAHATFEEARAVDEASAVELALDMTPLLRDDTLDVQDFARRVIDRFAADVAARLRRRRG